MALPKEPRQKMINLMYLVLTALLALNVSAEVIEAFKTVDNSLKNSNANIEVSNKNLFSSLEAKMNEEASKAKAAEWKPVADDAKVEADKMFKYLEDLKTELKTASGLKKDASGNVVLNEHGEEDYKLDDLNASSRIMENDKKGLELDQKLKDFKTALLKNPKVSAEFSKNFPVEVDPNGTTKSFRMMPTVAAITLLSKFQNNVRNAENQVVTYAHNQIGQVEVHMDQVGVLIGQSSNYVMPGEEISVTAGVGAYSSAAAPKISINGSSVAVTNGQGTYKTTASGGGEHSIAVNVTFIDENGKPQTKTETVKYTVGTPGGAAVMLDKMNVFYIGVDNPVTIGSPTGWEKTNVTMSGGTIVGTGSKRTVRVSAIGAASINVVADGKSSKFDFRVKRIPDPIFKVGDGKIRMASIAFKSQTSCRAELENFDFDLRYSVVSATVYFSGANFPNVVTASINGNSLGGLSAFISRCGPGSVISFDNIKVSGPDGVRSIEGKSIALY
jgi:gliding motility-associated protein GldM